MNLWLAVRVGTLTCGLGAFLVGCSGAGEDGAAQTIPAAKVCNGNISSDGAASVEFLTGTKEFSPIGNADPDVTFPKAAAALSNGYMGPEGSDSAPARACSIATPNGGSADFSVNFRTTTAESADGPTADTLKKYEVGRGAFVGIPRSYLYFNCVSPKFYGSTQKNPAVVFGELTNNAEGQGRYNPKGGSEKVREANLTLLNSISLSMAKELHCADNGGLKEKLTIKPATQTAAKS